MSTTTIPPFTDAHAERLRAFLAAPERPAGTLSLPKLRGFLFAVSCAPEFIKPSEWMPLVFNEAEPEYADPEEARDIIESMLSLYNHIARDTFEEQPALPPGCEAATTEPTANFGPDAPLGAWAGGFTLGHNWLNPLWEAYTPDDLDEFLGSTLLVLSFFARRELGERYLEEFDTKGQTLESMAAQMLQLLPEAMAGYAKLGRGLASVLERERSRQPAVSDKVGRNASCPCGSGKKYKKCCGGADSN